LERRKINPSTVLAGQNEEVKQVDDLIWQVSLMDYDLSLAQPFQSLVGGYQYSQFV
jgi:hypothetical protein